MSWGDTVLADQFAGSHSSVESDRFGLGISRAVVPQGIGAASGYDEARAFIEGSDDEIVVLRYPADRVSWFADLRATGRDLIFADSLIYWRLPIDGAPKDRGLPATASVAHGEPVGPELVDVFVNTVFDDYGNHYAANPLLDPSLALAGYRDWASRSASGDDVVTLSLEDSVVGLATTESSGGTCEILLAGVLPSHQRQGLYAGLLHGCEERAHAVSSKELVISTQGHNTGVQRAWARFGFEPVAAFVTVHAVRPGLLSSR